MAPYAHVKNAIFLTSVDPSLFFLANMVVSQVLIGSMMTINVLKWTLVVRIFNNHEKALSENCLPMLDMKKCHIFGPE